MSLSSVKCWQICEYIDYVWITFNELTIVVSLLGKDLAGAQHLGWDDSRRGVVSCRGESRERQALKRKFDATAGQ